MRSSVSRLYTASLWRSANTSLHKADFANHRTGYCHSEAYQQHAPHRRLPLTRSQQCFQAEIIPQQWLSI